MSVPSSGWRPIALTGVAVIVAGLLVATGLGRLRGGDGYEVTFVFPDAANLIAGSRVQVDGFTAGKVSSLEARDGQAMVTVDLDGKHAPLPAGTTARIAYQSLLGERVVEISPAKEGTAPLPDGAVVTGNTPRIELDQVLATMDPQTREAVSRLLPNLDAVLAGREAAAGETLEAAGPAVDALTEVLRAVGEDGPALRQLLTSVRDLSARLVARRESVRETIDGFDRNMSAVARQEDALREGLDELPGTLRQATDVFDRLPAAADASVPLLEDLRSATEALPAAARDLRPFLAELRTTLTELRPTLASLASLLEETPSMLDRAHSAVPDTTRAVAALLPAIDFLRPYTPEIAAIPSNFGSAAANYDANGHYLRVFNGTGTLSNVDQDSNKDPLVRENRHRPPGSLEKPRTDAVGSRVR